jgi:hypothetical protein
LAGKFQFRENLNKIKKAIDNNNFPQGELEALTGEPTKWFYEKYQLKGVLQ